MVHEATTRHLTTVLHNITRDLRFLSCFADNGYGTPIEALKLVSVVRRPVVTGPLHTVVQAGAATNIACRVDAWPAPSLAVYRDTNLTREAGAGSGGRVRVSALASQDRDSRYTVLLSIDNATEADGGRYYCHAANRAGTGRAVLGLTVSTPPAPPLNVTACCAERGVTPDCQDVCLLGPEFAGLARKPQCVSQYPSLMVCGAGGADHRQCCTAARPAPVPASCLDWCRGLPGPPGLAAELCALQHSRTIVRCFHEGREAVPGPPGELRVRGRAGSTSVTLDWRPPTRNPATVTLYRVFWRPQAADGYNRTDTADTVVTLHNLSPSTSYLLAVKAGNSAGTSQLTEPITFTTAAVAASSSRTAAPIAISLTLAAVVTILVILYRKNLIVVILRKPGRPNLAFDNPFQPTKPVETAETRTAAENENYNAEFSQSWSQAILPSSSSESSSGSSSPRENSEEGTGVRRTSLVDRLLSGVSVNSGFKRFT